MRTEACNLVYEYFSMNKRDAHILIVDDDEAILFSARIWLKKFFSKVSVLKKSKDLLRVFAEDQFDVILLDMNFRKGYEDGREGLYWMKEIKELDDSIPIILMTAYGEVSLAVEALREGATDFILKPWDNDKLYASVNMAVDMARKNRKLRQWEQVAHAGPHYLLQTASPKMEEVMRQLQQVAPTDANVLLLGENGTGKYVMAEYLHERSQRRNEPLVHIDLGSLSESLFESELFGYKKGAFTDASEDRPGKIESAQNGTIFLDEVSNLSLALQAKLLTLIQNRVLCRLGENRQRPVDVRFIFATNENLLRAVNEGRFRRDLYYRLNTVEIQLPALRDRREDILELGEYFLRKYASKYRKQGLAIAKQQELALMSYSWPGNIRELEHCMERSVILSENTLNVMISQPAVMDIDKENLNIEDMEHFLIKKALLKHRGNISQAADDLGLSRAALYRRMEKFGL